jgi:hypothetical protein
MISEALKWVLTPCSSWARESGLLHEAIALTARHARCRAAWQSHLENTKSVIETAISNCRQHRKVLVVGSGPQLDLPLDALAQTFDQVVLLDAVHPLKSRIKWYKNVRLLDRDITGIWSVLLDNPTEYVDADLPVQTQTFAHDENEIDLVISLNLATQLSSMPLSYLAGQKIVVDPGQAHVFRKAILEAHMNWLLAFEAQRCFMLDRGCHIGAATDVGAQEFDFCEGIEFPKPDCEWDWQIVPTGEDHDKISRTHHIAAWFNYPKI